MFDKIRKEKLIKTFSLLLVQFFLRIFLIIRNLISIFLLCSAILATARCRFSLEKSSITYLLIINLVMLTTMKHNISSFLHIIRRAESTKWRRDRADAKRSGDDEDVMWSWCWCRCWCRCHATQSHKSWQQWRWRENLKFKRSNTLASSTNITPSILILFN